MITDERKRAAIWMARGRTVLGLAALAAPAPIVGVWTGGESTGPSRALGRFIGGRDLTLGVGTIIAVESGDGGANWLSVCAVVDGIDAAVSLLQPGLPRLTRLLAVFAAASAVLHVRVAKEIAVIEDPDARV